MQFKRILSALLLVLVAWLQVGLPAMAAGVAGRVQLTGNTKATYRAAVGPFATAASATDVLTIYGSSTKTITITSIKVGQVASVAAGMSYYLVKRSATNTGGTSTNITAVPLDSNFAASTATNLKYYTANASSLGTSIGTIAMHHKYVASTSNESFSLYDASLIASPIVLRGTSEGLAVNFNAVTNPIGNTSYEIEWTEE